MNRNKLSQPTHRFYYFFESEEFGQVRVVTGQEGEPRFVEKDVAEVLGYRNAPDMTLSLDDEEAATHNLRSRSQNGNVQSREVTIINESGLYTAVLRSRRPEAKKFKRWVTTEILPIIRKHGMYATNDAIENIFADPDSGIRFLEEIKRVKAEKERIALERDEAVRTKAQISDKKTATAMSTASVYKRKYAVTANLKGREKTPAHSSCIELQKE